MQSDNSTTTVNFNCTSVQPTRSNREISTGMEEMSVIDADDTAVHRSPQRTFSWHRHIARLDPAFLKVSYWIGICLMIGFCSLVLVGIFYTLAIHYKKNSSSCDNPFGSILGASDGIFGFSNCNDNFISVESSYVQVVLPSAVKPQELYSGMKWQCVEYARRYWMLLGVKRDGGELQRATFGSVDGAADIWDLTEVRLLETQLALPMIKIRNGLGLVKSSSSLSASFSAVSFEGIVEEYENPIAVPRKGDLLLYSREKSNFPFGHVAVVVEVVLYSTEGASTLGNSGVKQRGYIRVAEQNWSSEQWMKPYFNYTREIPFSLDLLTKHVSVEDSQGPVLGWVRY